MLARSQNVSSVMNLISQDVLLHVFLLGEPKCALNQASLKFCSNINFRTVFLVVRAMHYWRDSAWVRMRVRSANSNFVLSRFFGRTGTWKCLNCKLLCLCWWKIASYRSKSHRLIRATPLFPATHVHADKNGEKSAPPFFAGAFHKLLIDLIGSSGRVIASQHYFNTVPWLNADDASKAFIKHSPFASANIKSCSLPRKLIMINSWWGCFNWFVSGVVKECESGGCVSILLLFRYVFKAKSLIYMLTLCYFIDPMNDVLTTTTPTSLQACWCAHPLPDIEECVAWKDVCLVLTQCICSSHTHPQEVIKPTPSFKPVTRRRDIIIIHLVAEAYDGFRICIKPFKYLPFFPALYLSPSACRATETPVYFIIYFLRYVVNTKSMKQPSSGRKNGNRDPLQPVRKGKLD